MRLCTNNGCGFQFVRYKRQLSTDFCSRKHAVCPLSGIKKRLLVGGFLYISTIVISIGATACVLYREVVRWWEGPLWEVPLYCKSLIGLGCIKCRKDQVERDDVSVRYLLVRLRGSVRSGTRWSSSTACRGGARRWARRQIGLGGVSRVVALQRVQRRK